MLNKTLIVIAGPTAIGKTELAIKVASHFNTEIISADSRQFYREMSVGTAKPTAMELSKVKHHLVDSHSIAENFTVGDYEEEALNAIDLVFQTNNFAVLTGGSGLFIQAVTEGFDDLPKAPPEVRAKLNGILLNNGIEALQEKLQELDPIYYGQVDLNNPQRIVRALEVCLSTGKPFSSLRTSSKKSRTFNIIKIALDMPREELYARINKRVDHMIREGLVAEVERLKPYRQYNALNTVGYQEIFEYLDSNISLAQAIEAIKQNTRRFAKRQLTWFRRDKEYKWFQPSELSGIIDLIKGETHGAAGTF